MKRRWETRWGGLDLTTEKMRKGRRRSPETGVGVVIGGFEVESGGMGGGAVDLSGMSLRGGSFDRPSMPCYQS